MVPDARVTATKKWWRLDGRIRARTLMMSRRVLRNKRNLRRRNVVHAGRCTTTKRLNLSWAALPVLIMVNNFSLLHVLSSQKTHICWQTDVENVSLYRRCLYCLCCMSLDFYYKPTLVLWKLEWTTLISLKVIILMNFFAVFLQQLRTQRE